MEQATLLAQLSREELYAIYQFLLLESRSPQEIPRNAQKEQMLDLLAQTLTLEEAQYCLEFFENYDFYEVPVLKWEMIDALPDDLLCALHSIYLDSIDFPETHEELVDSLSQSNYFLKEDARKFYLWFHYFRERILWEDTAPAQPGYNATVRYDLEEMGMADSFTMENYGDLLAEDAGLQGAEGGTHDYLDAAEMTAEHPGSSASMDDLETTAVPPEAMYEPGGPQPSAASITMDEGAGVGASPQMPPDTAPQTNPQAQAHPTQEQGPLQTQPNPPVGRQTMAYEPLSTQVESHDGPTMAEMQQPPTIGKSEPELTPLQQKLLASLQAEGGGTQRETVNQTIEINSFNLEAYMLEQEEAEAAAKAAAGPSLAEIREEMAAHDQQATVMGGAPPQVAAQQADGPSVIVDIPSEVVEGPMIDRTQGSRPPPPPPGGPRVRPAEQSSAGNVRSTMILDASAIITDDMQEVFARGPGAAQEPRRQAPPPPPGRQQKLSDLNTIDIDSARDFADQRPPMSDSEDEIEELEPIEVLEEDEVIEEVPLASSDAIPAMDPDMAQARPPQPPKPPPAPRKKRKRPAPRVPTRTGAVVEPEQLEVVTTVLYRTALLGATYARPQIRAIRIYIQKVLECSPEQLRLVRDTLKRLQAEDFPLVPPPLDQLSTVVSIVPYAARLQLVHSAIFLLGCKTLQNLDRYRDFLIDMAVELKLDPADISLFDLFGIVEEEIQLGVKDCLELFGLEDGASEGSIRKAHRAKVRLYHPDQYHSKGPEFVRLAERKMKESNMALEILLHRFNM